MRADINPKKVKTVHAIGFIQDGRAQKSALIGGESRLEIVKEEAGIFLYRLNDKGEIIADTWHLTIEEAKEQAAFEYSVEDEPHTIEGMQVGYRSECGVVIIFNIEEPRFEGIFYCKSN